MNVPQTQGDESEAGVDIIIIRMRFFFFFFFGFFLYFNRLPSEAGEPNLWPPPPAPFVVTTSLTVLKDQG